MLNWRPVRCASLVVALIGGLAACGEPGYQIGELDSATTGATTNSNTNGGGGSGGGSGTAGSSTGGTTGATAACTTDTYTNYAMGVLTAHCTVCHSPTGPESFVDLSTYAMVKLNLTQLKIPLQSNTMPPASTPASTAAPLSADDSNRMLTWVNCNAPM